MQKLEQYINVGTKRMRCGYTTGTCAAAATRAAAELLLANETVDCVEVATPAGISVLVEIEELERGDGWACAAVMKDSGDDPDVTNGALVYSRVELRVGGAGAASSGVADTASSGAVGAADEGAGAEPGDDAPIIEVDGGLGVGRVTREGLDQPVGAAAINSVPRAMIAAQAREVAERCGFTGALRVEISIPAGVELAARTFNPRLGIEGGISVLGTSGIVKPMSEDALIASIELEMKMIAARGSRDLLVVPGNYGRDYAHDVLGLDLENGVQCSNYIGACLDGASQLGFERVLVIGHIGKMIKVAAGIMNTHSRVADARCETMAAHAALCGADRATVEAIMESVTTDEVIPLLQERGLFDPVMASITKALGSRLNARAAGAFQIEALFFSKEYGTLGATEGAGELMKAFVIDGDLAALDSAGETDVNAPSTDQE